MIDDDITTGSRSALREAIRVRDLTDEIADAFLRRKAMHRRFRWMGVLLWNAFAVFGAATLAKMLWTAITI